MIAVLRYHIARNVAEIFSLNDMRMQKGIIFTLQTKFQRTNPPKPLICIDKSMKIANLNF